jgi:signal transduction histidine kinase
MRTLRRIVQLLASRRLAGVGLALVAEVGILAVLALAPPADVVGVPAAVAAGIAGTVAVVFGVVDGIAVVLAGAIAFAAFGGWEAGELAAIGVWPLIVAAVGLFGRRVELHRRALRDAIRAHERGNRSTALQLHDEDAQRLTAALLALRSGQQADVERARDLLRETIASLRRRAVDLSPKALEDHGLAAAVERLAADVGERSEIEVLVESRWSGRAPDEVELTLFRTIQATLASAEARGARSVRVTLDRGRDALLAQVDDDGTAPDSAEVAALGERLRLHGGRLTAAAGPAGMHAFQAELPA